MLGLPIGVILRPAGLTGSLGISPSKGPEGNATCLRTQSHLEKKPELSQTFIK